MARHAAARRRPAPRPIGMSSGAGAATYPSQTCTPPCRGGDRTPSDTRVCAIARAHGGWGCSAAMSDVTVLTRRVAAATQAHRRLPARRAPRVRAGVVRRERLVRRLEQAAAVPVLLLVAPAGYGKTTLLAQWVQRDRR